MTEDISNRSGAAFDHVARTSREAGVDISKERVTDPCQATLHLSGVDGSYHFFSFAMQIREVAMATGWAKEGAVQDQIDATIKDAIERARSQLPQGLGLTHCEQCDVAIPEARRKAVPGVRLCVSCQEARDSEQGSASGYNRRGSKDSQLR